VSVDREITKSSEVQQLRDELYRVNGSDHRTSNCDTVDCSNCKRVNCANVRASGKNSLYWIRSEVTCRVTHPTRDNSVRCRVAFDGVRIGNYSTLADSHTTSYFTPNLLRVLSLVFTVRFLATDLSQSHCNYSTRTVFTYRVQFSSCYHLDSSLSSDPILGNSLIFWWLDTPLEIFWLPNELSVQSQSHITTDGHSVSLGVEPHMELITRYLLLFDS
jgi:hypothetical protein